MPETEMLIGQGGTLPTVSAVKTGNGPYTVLIDWQEGSRTGTTDVIDLAPVILTYKVFKPLRDDARLFSTVRVSEYGDAIQWGEDDTLAVSGETLERLAEEVMTPAQFSDFMKRNKLSLDATAAQLGISRRMAAYYAKDKQIPRTVALACKQVELELTASRTKADWAPELRVGSSRPYDFACNRVPVGSYDLDVCFPTLTVSSTTPPVKVCDLAQQLVKRLNRCSTVTYGDKAQEAFVAAGSLYFHAPETEEAGAPYPPGLVFLARSRQL
ncbi:MAG: hypothetical protein PGN33_13320 [Methylobacterium radiotolerans]